MKSFSLLLKEAKHLCESVPQPQLGKYSAYRLNEAVNLYSVKDHAGRMAVAIRDNEDCKSLYFLRMAEMVKMKISMDGENYSIIWSQSRFLINK
jgi:hypothetical protein